MPSLVALRAGAARAAWSRARRPVAPRRALAARAEAGAEAGAGAEASTGTRSERGRATSTASCGVIDASEAPWAALDRAMASVERDVAPGMALVGPPPPAHGGFSRPPLLVPFGCDARGAERRFAAFQRQGTFGWLAPRIPLVGNESDETRGIERGVGGRDSASVPDDAAPWSRPPPPSPPPAPSSPSAPSTRLRYYPFWVFEVAAETVWRERRPKEMQNAARGVVDPNLFQEKRDWEEDELAGGPSSHEERGWGEEAGEDSKIDEPHRVRCSRAIYAFGGGERFETRNAGGPGDGADGPSPQDEGLGNDEGSFSASSPDFSVFPAPRAPASYGLRWDYVMSMAPSAWDDSARLLRPAEARARRGAAPGATGGEDRSAVPSPRGDPLGAGAFAASEPSAPLDAPDVPRAVAWGFALRALRESEREAARRAWAAEAVARRGKAADVAAAAAGGGAVSGASAKVSAAAAAAAAEDATAVPPEGVLLVQTRVTRRRSRLVYYPVIASTYLWGEGFNVHGERAPERFDALVSGVSFSDEAPGGAGGPPNGAAGPRSRSRSCLRSSDHSSAAPPVSGFRHVSAARASVAAAGSFVVAAAAAEAAGFSLASPSASLGHLSAVVELSFATLCAGAGGALLARLAPVLARQREAERVAEAEAGELAAAAAMGLSPLSEGSDEAEEGLRTMEWRRYVHSANETHAGRKADDEARTAFDGPPLNARSDPSNDSDSSDASSSSSSAPNDTASSSDEASSSTSASSGAASSSTTASSNASSSASSSPRNASSTAFSPSSSPSNASSAPLRSSPSSNWDRYGRRAWAGALLASQARRRAERRRLARRLQEHERLRKAEALRELRRRAERHKSSWEDMRRGGYAPGGGAGGSGGDGFYGSHSYYYESSYQAHPGFSAHSSDPGWGRFGGGGAAGGGAPQQPTAFSRRRFDFLGLYADLGLGDVAGPDVTEKQVKDAFRKAALAWHPDRQHQAPEQGRQERGHRGRAGDEGPQGGGERGGASQGVARERFDRAKRAYEVLRNPDLRRQYDAGRRPLNRDGSPAA